MRPHAFQARVLKWYDQHGRKHLPWQQDMSAYKVWLSEIMLQQTQVTTVIPYFQRFMATFPNIKALSLAHVDQVLQHWSGLGYYARARNLHKTAQIITTTHHGKFPQTIEGLMALPGIGRSTAGAILSLAYQIPAPILDGNVKRVLSRFLMLPSEELWEPATKYTPANRVRDYTQAMMDLGSMICTRSSPACDHCPLQSHCRAYQQDCVSDYPIRRQKAEKPVKSVFWLITQPTPRTVYLVQRPMKGIWGGLWCFPEVATLQGLEPLDIRDYAEPFRHTFTHYHLDINPIFLEASSVPTGARSFSAGECGSLGLPAPVKKVLMKLLPTPAII